MERLESYWALAREGMMSGLKASGERFADLRQLTLDELYDDYKIYRKQQDTQFARLQEMQLRSKTRWKTN